MSDPKKPEQPKQKPRKSLWQKLKDKVKGVADDAGNALGEAFDNR